MNSSSGIKRGLAATAVAALAVTGIPALASSASAETGDVIQISSVGPTLNGGSTGGVVVLKTKNITEAEAEGDPADPATAAFKITNTTLNGSPNNANQAVAFVGTPVFTANATDSDPTDGFDEVTLRIAATTSDDGGTANYALYLDDNDDDTVQAIEQRVQVSQTTAGALAKVVVTPGSQSAPQGIASGKYTATLQDAAGRTTQLDGGDTVGMAITPDGSVSDGDATLDETELALGTATFTAQSPNTGTKTITLDPSSVVAATANGTATLNVTAAATITPADVDIVTGADSWNGPGDGGAGNFAVDTLVRVDQGTITIKFNGGIADANSTVSLNITSGAFPFNVTFGGAASTTASTVLDANGVGEIVITPDAFTVQDGDSIDITGSFTHTIEFDRAAPQTTAPSGVYFSQIDGSVDVTATFTDQFGMPITTGFISARRTGANADTPPGQTKPIGADGTATFTFTDEDAVLGSTESVVFEYRPDQFALAATATGGTTIKYTADGKGADFGTEVNDHDTSLPAYDPADETVIPLTDTDADAPGEDATLEVLGGEANTAVTVTVDNGAKILESGESLLSEASESVTTTLDGGGDLTGGDELRIIGTKSGLVTATIVSGNRTETVQLTVSPQVNPGSARNLAVSGPAEVESGATQIAYTAVVTDAFGNPVPNYTVDGLNIQVTGPAQFQDSDAQTNAAGELNLNVRVDSDAVGDVSIKVTGLQGQFGAAKDRLSLFSVTDDGKGLTASDNVAEATTMVKPAEVVKEGINLKLNGKNNGAKADKLTANAKSNAAGLTAVLYKGKKQVASHKLNAQGNWTFKVKDTNGKKATNYVVKVAATDTTKAGKDNRKVK